MRVVAWPIVADHFLWYAMSSEHCFHFVDDSGCGNVVQACDFKISAEVVTDDNVVLSSTRINLLLHFPGPMFTLLHPKVSCVYAL